MDTPDLPTTTPHEPSRAARPPFDPVDLDRSRRPGVPKERAPQPWPNSRFPPERMRARPSAPKHGRPGKPMPPVYGTAVPPRGVSGALRRLAYRRPDHETSHWLMLLLADRVDSWGTRAWRVVRIVTPLGVLAFLGARAMGLVRR